MPVWPWIIAGLLMAGCATDKHEEQIAEAERTPSARRTVEPAPVTPPMAKETAPPPVAKKAPPAPRHEEDEVRREIPPPPPRQESDEGRRARPPAAADQRKVEPSEPTARKPEPKAPEPEPQPEQHAKAPVTPMDQSGSRDDIETTRRIRKALMNEDLSFQAKNVLVITEQDRVVLKGTVSSPSEADRVKRVAGMMTTKPIDDRLEVGGR